MSSKQILIVSSRELFREGLKLLLGSISGLAPVLHADSLQESEKIARTQKVDIVIIDHADETTNKEAHQETVSYLLRQPNIRVITISLTSGDMWVYRQERVTAASVEDLATALTG
ncbi:MAG: response regulator transcription factor [Chloroflexi bacterium]|nr:response regulator transcription factor [Chloroflexota bacterium]